MIISISGRPGSGKSAVAIRVAEALGKRHVSAGDFMRELASERGMTILEFSRTAEDRASIDHEIDARTRRLSEESDDFVIDARLGWHFIPHSFKVFLEVSPEVAARRIYGAQRGSETENITLEETLRAIEERTRSERTRYQKYYGLDYADHDHYDLVVDTSERSIGEVVETIMDGLPDS
ncbi:MAG TPA: cytidylate kinase family protein [Acidimicrobiia bacterium]|nr:cytidylate kinase family protein [Acidimicrobiia bacterium]